MANDYIRREDAIKGKKTGTFANGICLVAKPCVTVEYIESLEPADVVPVVRCKNCKHNTYDEIFSCYWCEYPGRVRETTPDGFCEKGEE